MEKKTVDTVKEALENSKGRRFKETVEMAINLKGVDLSIPKNRIDVEVPLPKGRGKTIKIGIFASGELAVKSKDAADVVIMPEQIDDLAGDKKKAKKLANEYDFFIAEAPLMPVIGKKLGAVLAPRGKMPKPVPPMADPKSLINNLKNTVRARSKKSKTFHVPVGVRDMKPEDIAENIDAVLKRVEDKLALGKMNIGSVYVKTTMGKAVRMM
ncbi:MAG: 50S ribosomal protein L1 [Euryarchaeota archaeon CG01_land_8_20_14_3_00_38_12]|nr:MAG: 50S ribosomal protein L1 [Euryarchaeota archaeon CG01_land_8_20_14_3_00_38_12]PJB21002.1 MAG: 50S ribosomal protein L1 [Euryarchaeota archaeon CG_4_9_14_3_um_filter_38_12]